MNKLHGTMLQRIILMTPLDKLPDTWRKHSVMNDCGDPRFLLTPLGSCSNIELGVFFFLQCYFDSKRGS